jgi:hypothetical protein
MESGIVPRSSLRPKGSENEFVEKLEISIARSWELADNTNLTEEPRQR